jgi:hypothetical protein
MNTKNGVAFGDGDNHIQDKLFITAYNGIKYLYKKSIFHNSILAFKNQKRTIKVGDSPSLN